jgi:hypothetical protein
MIATDVGEHIANDTERRDHRDPVRGSRRTRQQQDGQRDKVAKHQAVHPIIGARRRKELAATSETPRGQYDRRTGGQIAVIGDEQSAIDATSPKPVAT